MTTLSEGKKESFIDHGKKVCKPTPDGLATVGPSDQLPEKTPDLVMCLVYFVSSSVMI